MEEIPVFFSVVGVALVTLLSISAPRAGLLRIAGWVQMRRPDVSLKRARDPGRQTMAMRRRRETVV